MRVIVEMYREAGGRLTGAVHRPDGSRDAFASTLDLLRVLEALDLSRPDDPAPQSQARNSQAFEPESEVRDD
jgi:hypothetical protein